MNTLNRNYCPPQLNRHYDFADMDYFEESDYEDENCHSFANLSFLPKWDSVHLEKLDNLICFCPYCGRFV